MLPGLPYSSIPTISVSAVFIIAIYAPARSISSCYHPHFGTCAPGCHSFSSHNPIIGRVTIYSATVFCLQLLYSYKSFNPASLLPSPKGVCSHIPSGILWGCLPIRRQATLWWKPPSIRPMRGFTTQVSDPMRRTACTNSLKKLTNTRTSTPYLPRILYILS